MTLPSSAEVLIVGAGPTGMVLALALQKNGCPDVVIVDGALEGEIPLVPSQYTQLPSRFVSSIGTICGSQLHVSVKIHGVLPSGRDVRYTEHRHV